jgi:hypothetical protein
VFILFFGFFSASIGSDLFLSGVPASALVLTQCYQCLVVHSRLVLLGFGCSFGAIRFYFFAWCCQGLAVSCLSFILFGVGFWVAHHGRVVGRGSAYDRQSDLVTQSI